MDQNSNNKKLPKGHKKPWLKTSAGAKSKPTHQAVPSSYKYQFKDVCVFFFTSAYRKCFSSKNKGQLSYILSFSYMLCKLLSCEIATPE